MTPASGGAPCTMALTALLCLLATSCLVDAQDDDDIIDVRLPPAIVEESSDKTIIYKAESAVLLPCVATGTPKPKYSWIHNGKPLNLNIGNIIKNSESGSITIDPLFSLNEGYYQCSAENIHGVALSSVVYLQRAVLADFVTSAVTQYSANEGDALTVKCNSPKSVPASTYSWATVEDAVDRNMIPINMDHRMNIDDQGNLYFSDVIPADSKDGRLYICNVYNPYRKETKHGSLSQLVVTATPDAQDREPELMYISAKLQVALVGSTMKLKCLFSAKPSDSLHHAWFKLDGDLPTDRYALDQGHTTLTIKDVSKEDEGVYRCTATNSVGSDSRDITVIVESVPTFVSDEAQPRPANATGGNNVSFICSAQGEPPPHIQWFVDGKPLEIDSLGPRFSLSPDAENLTVTDVCKDCDSGDSDLTVFSCNASNTHGYAYASGYLNVLVPTVITVHPVPFTLVYYEPVVFRCEADSDDSTPVLIDWLRDGELLQYQAGRIEKAPDNSLYITTENEDEDGGASFAAGYSCRATNGYSTVVSDPAQLSVPPDPTPIKPSSLADLWWIFLIIVLIILLLLLLICCCLCVQRSQGDTYPVDEKERANGNDPEKELLDNGFHDYLRPEDQPAKGSRASLSSTESFDEGSLAEYGDIDPTKFNEDGSFIGQYTGDKRRKPPGKTSAF